MTLMTPTLALVLRSPKLSLQAMSTVFVNISASAPPSSGVPYTAIFAAHTGDSTLSHLSAPQLLIGSALAHPEQVTILPQHPDILYVHEENPPLGWIQSVTGDRVIPEIDQPRWMLT
jgi:hypothetical protein